MGRAKKERQLQKLSLLYVLAPLVAVGGVLQQNAWAPARSPRAGDARGPRIGLKWAGEARPFQGLLLPANRLGPRNRAVRGRYESRSNTLAPLVAVVVPSAERHGRRPRRWRLRRQRQLGLLTQLRDRQRTAVAHGGTDLSQRGGHAVCQSASIGHIGVHALLKAQLCGAAQIVALPVPGAGAALRPNIPSYSCRPQGSCWWETRQTGRNTGPACRNQRPWPEPA